MKKNEVIGTIWKLYSIKGLENLCNQIWLLNKQAGDSKGSNAPKYVNPTVEEWSQTMSEIIYFNNQWLILTIL